MRDLDEALARLARRDRLHKRHANGGHERSGNAVHEVTETVRQLVERYPGLTVVARLEDGDTCTEIKAAREEDRVEVTTREILSGAVLPPPPRDDSPTESPPSGENVFDVEVDRPGLGSALHQFGLGRTIPLDSLGEMPGVGEPTPVGPPDWPPHRS